MTHERMRREAPLDAAALASVERSDVVVVRGIYDRVEQVLDALAVPHTVIDPAEVRRLRLRPEQLLVVNCPGKLDRRAVERIGGFVRHGGSLFTTDWALTRVIERAFPGTVAHNGVTTRDDVVGIALETHTNPFLSGVVDDGDDPQWWLEASSYPIRILDRSRVEVLITSGDLAARYGEPAVAVVFPEGEGEVFHMISHYYLQRTELRTARHAAPAVAYAADKAVAPAPDLDGLSLGDVESATSSVRMLANIVAQKKRRVTRS